MGRIVALISSSPPAPTTVGQVEADDGKSWRRRSRRRWSTSPRRSSRGRGKPSRRLQVEAEARAEDVTEVELVELEVGRLTTMMQWTLQLGTMSVDLIG